MGWIGIVLISIGATIIGGLILSFIMPILKKPRDKFISWIQKIFTKKKKKRKEVISDPQKEQKLKQLIQNKFNRERGNIDPELDKNIRDIMEKFGMKGLLYSSVLLKKAIELHTDRIRKLLEAKKNINKEVLLENKPITSDEEIKLALQDLKKIAEAQKSAIFGCENVLNRMNAKDNFVKEMSQNISQILSNIQRDLTIEKDENLLLKKKRR
jgi:hypothetical protein